MDFVPFPTFSSENLLMWFAQMESVFTLNGIIAESDKYDYFLANVPADSLKLVEDIVFSPATDDKYELIKYEFIKRMLIHKLKKEEIGNKKPSEYLRKLKEIAGRRISNEIILNVWKDNLPEKVREIISLETSGNMDRLCEMADKAMVLAPPNIGGLADRQFDFMMRGLNELKKQVNILQMMYEDDFEVDYNKLVNNPNTSKKQ